MNINNFFKSFCDKLNDFIRLLISASHKALYNNNEVVGLNAINAQIRCVLGKNVLALLGGSTCTLDCTMPAIFSTSKQV